MAKLTMVLQGPHQEAEKSTTTTDFMFPARMASSSPLLVISVTWPGVVRAPSSFPSVSTLPTRARRTASWAFFRRSSRACCVASSANCSMKLLSAAALPGKQPFVQPLTFRCCSSSSFFFWAASFLRAFASSSFRFFRSAASCRRRSASLMAARFSASSCSRASFSLENNTIGTRQPPQGPRKTHCCRRSSSRRRAFCSSCCSRASSAASRCLC